LKHVPDDDPLALTTFKLKKHYINLQFT
jgi:hypothetical protein